MTALFKAAAYVCQYSFSSFNFAFCRNTAFEMPTERSARSEVPSRRVRKKAGPTRDALPESITIEERAEPFRLMTVKFPIDEMNAEWSMGSDRYVDAKPVRQLCQVFMSMAYHVKTVLTALACFAARKMSGQCATASAWTRPPMTTAPIHPSLKAGLRSHHPLQSCWLVIIVYMR